VPALWCGMSGGPQGPELHVSGDEIIERRRAAAIWHLLKLDAGDRRKPLRHHVLAAHSASRRVAQPRLPLGERDQLGERRDAQRGMRRKHDGLTRELDDRRESLSGSMFIL
jgi:hypothetical protein